VLVVVEPAPRSVELISPGSGGNFGDNELVLPSSTLKCQFESKPLESHPGSASGKDPLCTLVVTSMHQ